MTSRIAVRPRNKTIDPGIGITSGIGGDLFQHCESTRQTEQDALQRGHVPEFSALHRRIAELEKIARDPKNYLVDYNVADRPARPIFGAALLSWIGRQAGVKMTGKEVGEWLKDIERIYAIRAKNGMKG